MQIVCTLNEFADLVRGCFSTVEAGECDKCPLYRLCDSDGTPGTGIERFVPTRNIICEEDMLP